MKVIFLGCLKPENVAAECWQLDTIEATYHWREDCYCYIPL